MKTLRHLHENTSFNLDILETTEPTQPLNKKRYHHQNFSILANRTNDISKFALHEA